MLLQRSAAGDLLTQPLRGHFAYLGKVLGILYRLDDVLRLRLGDRDFLLAGADRVEWSVSGPTATLEIVLDPERISVQYSAGQSLVNDPTPFVEAEHFDFGLFVSNVASNDKRAGRMYQGP